MENKINKILGLIRKMEQNTFLLPDSWSEQFNMISRSAHYKTYVGGRGDNSRYINIEYTKNEELYNPKQEDCYNIEIRKNEIYLQKRLGEKTNEIDLVLDVVEAIYKEKISFEIMDKVIATKRLQAKELKEEIKRKIEKFNKLTNELKDSKKIS